MAGEVIEALDLVLLRRTHIGIAKPLLEIEGRDGLVVKGDLDVVRLCHCRLIQGDEIFDFIGAGELGVGVIGVVLGFTRYSGQFTDIC